MRTLIALLLSVSAAAPALAEAPDELDRALEILDVLDNTRITHDATLHELRGALMVLEEHTPVPIRVDWDSLDRLGVDDDEQVVLEARDASLSDVLQTLMFQLADEFERPTFDVFADHIVITTVAGSGPLRMTGVYDVRDVLARGDAKDSLLAPVAPTAPAPSKRLDDAGDDEPIFDNEEGKATPSAQVADPDPAGPDPDADPVADPIGKALENFEPRLRSPGEDLMMFIAAHVDPEAWLDYGGTRARMTEREGIVLVSATARTHRMFRRVLDQLRRVHPAVLRFEASIVEIDRKALATLQRRYEPASAALAAGIGREASETIWRSAVVVATGKTAQVTTEESSAQFVLGLGPREEPNSGRILVDVEASATNDEGRRSVTTTAAVGLASQRGAAIVLELSGGPGSDSANAQLLVLVASPG